MLSLKFFLRPFKIHKRRRHIRDFFHVAKDGIITGAADNDPAGVVTYTQVGATVGFSQLWLMLLSLPILAAVEEMSARVGVVTKHGLNAIISKYFGYRLALVVALIVVFANVATIGADIAGMAEVIGIFFKINFVYFILPLALILISLLLAENYQKMSRLFFILTPLFLLYVAAGILTQPNWHDVIVNTVVPHLRFNISYIALAVGLLGTTISPYLLFWQTTEEVEDKKTIRHLKEEKYGVFWGMFYSHFIFYFIIVTAAAVLFGNIGSIETAREAALALKPLAGELAFFLFALAILVSGFLAIPVLAATTAYVTADTFHWKEGLDKKLFQARGFYVVLIGALIFGGLLVGLGINPVKMLVYSQILNGFLMPILLIILLKVTSNPQIMSKYTNGFWSKFFGWLGVLVFVFLDLMLVWQWLK